jgi:tetratricopeptide (TPR) repeat protein
VDATLGLGYAHYSLRQYDEALAVWQTAVAQDENNPILYISLGTLYWRVGTLGKNYNALSGSDRCSQAFLPDEAKMRSADLLTQSIENLEKSIPLPNQTDAERAFTYRTIAQVQYLLRNCPEHDKAAVLQDAIASYQQAAELDAVNPLYWHMQGRLSYAVWQSLPPDTGPPAREWLFRGLSANEVAISLNNVDTGDYKPNAWEGTLMQAIGSTLARGDDRFANGEYEVALQYYELMTTNQPDNAEAAFKAALAQLALGDSVSAEASLQRGRELAQDQPELVELYQTKWMVYKLFQEALAATAEGEEREAAALYDEAIQQAAAAELLDVVQAGASDLRDYLLANEGVRVTAVYWPLEYTAPSRDLSALDRRDLFWRYRAEFGYRLTQGLFNALPGREAEYAAIFNSVTSDIQQAAELESKAHATRAEFFTNSNIGWLYLRRGDTYFAEDDYVRALSDYNDALRLISPDGETSLADLTEAMFKAALTAVATNDYQRAAAWYDQATQQATRLDDQNIVRAAATALGQFLLDNPNINPLNVYWPLQVGDPAWSRTTARDLYWRYRAEFGFRLISALFNNTPDQEAAHETIFATVIADIERAYALDGEAHREQRNFLVDTNMGWFYLQRGSDRFKAENYANALADFQEAIGRFRTDSGVAISHLMNANLQAGLAALLLGDLEQAAVYYNYGLELAAQIEAFDSVLAAANALATALQENPNIDQTAAFWPLQDDRGARETAVSQRRNPDLYWRYRAEFGFRLISRLFAASSGSEEAYETMFTEVIADIEAAYTLNPEDHQVKRDFFVDGNIGWFYLQRGNEHRANGRYAQALADYEKAVERMRPDSINARNDLLDAMFNAGLSALSLNNFAEAQEWYRRGISLASEYEETGALNRAGKELELLLFGRSLDG